MAFELDLVKYHSSAFSHLSYNMKQVFPMKSEDQDPYLTSNILETSAKARIVDTTQ